MTDQKASESTQGTSAPEELKAIEKVSVKLPPFWSAKPSLWFKVVEAQFNTNGVTTDKTKYFYILQALDHKTLDLIEDLVSNPPETGAYPKIRNTLIQRLADSDNTRVQKLIKDMELGDKKPSQLL